MSETTSKGAAETPSIVPTLTPGYSVPEKRKRGRPKNPDGPKLDLRKNHTGVQGKRIDPRIIDRAEALYTGIGPEGAPLPYSKIVQILRKETGRSKRQCEVYIRVAKQRLKERYATFDPEAAVEQSDTMFLDAFAVAKQKSDPHGMVAATQRRAELRGIFVRNAKVETTVKGLADLFGEVFNDA